MKKEQSSALTAALVGGKLLLICAIVAGIVSFVYALTEKPYEANIKEQKRLAISQIYDSDTVSYTELEGVEEIQALYIVKEGEALRGYCAEVASPGFGGDVELMIGFDADKKILGIRVISHSETPGVGAPVVSEGAYLDQYKGHTGQVTLGEGVDAVSGATISSTAVAEGVNRAVQAIEQLGGKSHE